MHWELKNSIEFLEKIIQPGIIGTYQSFEVNEIFGYFDKDKTPINFFSLLVASPILEPSPSSSQFLNQKRLKLNDTKWSFGIRRYHISPEKLLDTLKKFGDTKNWNPAGTELKVGNLAPIPPQFIPSDSYQPHPWNGILKNNFWNGSHLLELFDTSKSDIHFLLDNPIYLTDLAELIRSYIPIGIDGLSDRLGNILIQLPVTIVVTEFKGKEDDSFLLNQVWHPNHNPRPLQVTWEILEDYAIESFTSKLIGEQSATLPINAQRTGARYVIWDDANQVILGASAHSAFFGDGSNFSISISALYSENREFRIPIGKSEMESISIPIFKDKHESQRQIINNNPREPWRSKRIFKDSLHVLQQNKEFIQYGGPSPNCREDALNDIRWLIKQHGQNGAWLWDPYLNAQDILNTLFFCPHPDVDLRALSSGRQPSSNQTNEQSDQSWEKTEQAVLMAHKGNCKWLNLEFRTRKGSRGWNFHDRFLIFPGIPGQALAWSLGTSINSLGNHHHILQKVSNGELIKQAFLELWNTLPHDEHIIWHTP